MTDFTVIRYGTDSSGRAIYMTRYMAEWLDAVKADPKVAPFAEKIVVTQGAFMTRTGGGAAASAGYHDQAGCIDFRSWNLTAEERTAFIRACRRRGGAASYRTAADGFPGNEHIHCTLGGDRPYSPGAASSWAQYVAGTNGLANHAPDREWRPDPLVLSYVPERPKHAPVRVGLANLNQFQGGDSQHIAHLTESADVLELVECIDAAGRPIDIGALLGQGWQVAQDTSTSAKAGSVVAWRTDVLTAYRKPALKLLTDEVVVGGKVRVRTRYLMVQSLKVNATGEKYRFAAGHFPPNDGPEWRATWPAGIARVRSVRARPLLPPLVAGFDRNDDIHEFADDVRMLAEGRGIVGILRAPKRVRLVSTWVDTVPKEQGWTDHNDVYITIERR